MLDNGEIILYKVSMTSEVPQGPAVPVEPTGASAAYSPVLPGQKGATHETYIEAIRSIVANRIPDLALRDRLLHAKLVYGRGNFGVRGTCYYGVWANGQPHNLDFIEISALGEENPVQLAGTTVHELGHVLAGHLVGHGHEWKDCCEDLGLCHAIAAGQEYQPSDFEPGVWAAISALPLPTDGTPAFMGGLATPGLLIPKGPIKARPCPLGQGTRGGKSRGKGSGSRYRLYECQCVPDPAEGTTNKARVASDTWSAVCQRCHAVFQRVHKAPPEPGPRFFQPSIPAIIGAIDPPPVTGGK